MGEIPNEIYVNHIFIHLSEWDMIKLSMVCKKLNQIYKQYFMPDEEKINTDIKDFIKQRSRIYNAKDIIQQIIIKIILGDISIYYLKILIYNYYYPNEIDWNLILGTVCYTGNLNLAKFAMKFNKYTEKNIYQIKKYKIVQNQYRLESDFYEINNIVTISFINEHIIELNRNILSFEEIDKIYGKGIRECIG